MKNESKMKTARRSFGDDYNCQQNWPNDSFLQCGGSGIVLSNEGNYETAFFEAFLLNTFLRGQGVNIEEAELNAFKKYLQITQCKCHHFEKKEEHSRRGVCSICHYDIDLVFPPDEECSICGKEHVNFALNIINLQSGKRENYCSIHFMEKAVNFTFEGWFSKELEEILTDEQKLKFSQTELSFSEKSYVDYIKHVNKNIIIKRMLISLYSIYFGENFLREKYVDDYLFGDEINRFIKQYETKNVNKLMLLMKEISVIKNYKIKIFEYLAIMDELVYCHENLYRIAFFSENNVPIEKQHEIYLKLGLPFVDHDDEIKYIIMKAQEVLAKKY